MSFPGGEEALVAQALLAASSFLHLPPVFVPASPDAAPQHGGEEGKAAAWPAQHEG
jgi:hypothetical protein